MGSIAGSKPHAVCIPLPAQGHINPMLKLAKLLHYNGFHITFVHTEFNYHRLGRPKDLDAFKFETIPDGLPDTNPRGILDLPDLGQALLARGSHSFRTLMEKLNSSGVPDVSYIISDGVMSFTLEVAMELGIPAMVLFTPSACGLLGYLHFEQLKQRGYFPLKDESCLTNGYLDTVIDWIPGMNGIRLKDLPTFIRSTDPNDIMFRYNVLSVNNSMKFSQGLILNTFDELEQEVLDAIKTKFPQLYTIGPLSMLLRNICPPNFLEPIESNLWEADTQCLKWLDKKEAKSVVYVNYGSLVIMTEEQLKEFAWGLANSGYSFLWVIRPNLVNGGDEIMSKEFVQAISDRGLLVKWCDQEKVIGHPSIGVFLTHCGWNSTLESICEGVPMICWPFFADQQTNCLYLCQKWKIGMEIDSDVKREKVEGIIKELMEGEKGKEIRKVVSMWKMKAHMATISCGTSFTNFQRLLNQLKQNPSTRESIE